MTVLYLFDIDGTLLHAAGSGRAAFDAAFVKRFTDLPLLVRMDTLKLLHASDIANAPAPATLTNFTRVKDVEFPVPHSIYEAIYTPVANAESPNYSPPAVRVEIQLPLEFWNPSLQTMAACAAGAATRV